MFYSNRELRFSARAVYRGVGERARCANEGGFGRFNRIYLIKSVLEIYNNVGGGGYARFYAAWQSEPFPTVVS